MGGHMSGALMVNWWVSEHRLAWKKGVMTAAHHQTPPILVRHYGLKNNHIPYKHNEISWVFNVQGCNQGFNSITMLWKKFKNLAENSKYDERWKTRTTLDQEMSENQRSKTWIANALTGKITLEIPTWPWDLAPNLATKLQQISYWNAPRSRVISRVFFPVESTHSRTHASRDLHKRVNSLLF